MVCTPPPLNILTLVLTPPEITEDGLYPLPKIEGPPSGYFWHLPLPKKEGNVKNENNLKFEDNLKNEDELKDEDVLKNCPPTPKQFWPPLLWYYLNFLKASHLDSYTTNDIKPKMLSGVQTGNKISHD